MFARLCVYKKDIRPSDVCVLSCRGTEPIRALALVHEVGLVEGAARAVLLDDLEQRLELRGRFDLGHEFAEGWIFVWKLREKKGNED